MSKTVRLWKNDLKAWETVTVADKQLENLSRAGCIMRLPEDVKGETEPTDEEINTAAIEAERRQ